MNRIALLFIIVFFTIYCPAGLIAQDWADLEHFRKDNRTLKAPEANEKRVVFMGNSITIGWQNKNADFFTKNNYVNRGISGQTTPQMLLRFRQDVIDLEPNAVVILAGTNDIAGNTGPSSLEMIVDNLVSMTELARANNIEVIICSVLPAFDYPWRKGLQPNVKIPKLNALIKEYCTSHNVVYLDYFSAMTDGKNGMREELASDGVHPNKKGYDLMEPLLQKAINEVLK